MLKGSKPRFFYGYIVVAASFLIILLMWGTFYSFGVLLKPLVADFGWTKEAISGAYSLAHLLSGFLGIVTGRLTDKFGPKVIILVCGPLLGLGYLLMSGLSTIWQLYLFYGVIIGAAMSGTVVPLTSTVARWFVKRRGVMMGTVLAGFGAGIMIMPVMISHLLYSYGWSTSCTIIGSVVLVLVVAAAMFLKRDPGQIGLSPYGYNGPDKAGQSLQTNEFSFQEAIHFRQFWLMCAITLCFGFCTQVIMVHIIPHSIEIGISAEKAATILATLGGVSIASRIILGSAADRVGPRLSFTITFIFAAVALLWLIPSNASWMLYLFAVIYGVAYGGESALRPLMVAELFGLSSHGVTHGVVLVNIAIGGAIGPLLAGRIADTYGSYSLIFKICVVLGIIAFILTLFIKPTISKERI